MADIAASPRPKIEGDPRGIVKIIYTHPSSTEALNEVLGTVQ